MLGEVLADHPMLARLIHHLPVYDQLRLSVEAVRPKRLADAFSKGLATVSRASSRSQCVTEHPKAATGGHVKSGH
jgi:hypothetical protein